MYNPEDLELNLQGCLSSHQRIKLLVIAFFRFAIIGLNITGICILIYWLTMNYINIIVSGVWMVVFGVFAFSGIRNITPLWKDIQNKKIEIIHGQIKKKHFAVRRNKGYDSYFTVEVRDSIFYVSPSLYYALMDNRSYRLFYAGNSKWILNADTN